METNNSTTEIYNLIILDESGSMCGVTAQTISGCNETINTIKSAQQQNPTQRHYVSIYAFQSSGSRPSRYILKNALPDGVRPITEADYEPHGMTPLNDAVGSTLTDLKATVHGHEDAIGSVTIITDGYENSSHHYTTQQVAKMIDALKEIGWSFNFIGANIDVEGTAARYNIDNSMEFQQTQEGTMAMFEKERMSRMHYYERMKKAKEAMCAAPMSDEERHRLYKEAAAEYFEKKAHSDDAPRISPDRIDTLQPNEVFVFGSNLAGVHGGGAARVALNKFGAIMGQGVGLQGQSYAIPTMQGGVDTIRPYVDEFVGFARQHPELKFLVTRIGCGIAGFRDADIAPLFREALNVENVFLPRSFYDILTNPTAAPAAGKSKKGLWSKMFGK